MLVDFDILGGRPPKVSSCKLVALLGRDDEMWPAERHIGAWAEVAAAGFEAVTIAGVPHHLLMNHIAMREAVFGELAVTMAGKDGLAKNSVEQFAC